MPKKPPKGRCCICSAPLEHLRRGAKTCSYACRAKVYYKTHSKKINDRSRAWQEAHPDWPALRKQKRLDNLEDARAYERAWWELHGDRVNAERRAKRQAAKAAKEER